MFSQYRFKVDFIQIKKFCNTDNFAYRTNLKNKSILISFESCAFKLVPPAVGWRFHVKSNGIVSGEHPTLCGYAFLSFFDYFFLSAIDI